MTDKSLHAKMFAAVTSHSEVMCSKAASGFGETIQMHGWDFDWMETTLWCAEHKEWWSTLIQI